MSDLVRRRRDELCDLLAGLSDEQWAAETLCTGWDAGDVAAHLITREREPWTGPGAVLGGPFRALTDARRNAWKARGRDVLVRTLRAGPPWPLSGPLASSQIVEDWIHEQDVRRGGAGLETPEPEAAIRPLLWTAAKRFATRTLALGDDVVVELTDGTRHHRVRASRRSPLTRPTSARADVIVTAPVSELLLYVTGRADAAVAVHGEARARTLLAASARTL